MGRKLAITDDGMKKAQQFLYLNLLQFTKGDSHSRAVAIGASGAFEIYRQLVFRGRNSTVTSQMDQRMKVMQPEKARIVEEVEMKVTQWKSDIRILRETRQKQDIEMVSNSDQMITILIGMLPDVLADHLISKFAPGASTFDEMLIELQDHLMKVDQKRTARKIIKQVTKKEDEQEESFGGGKDTAREEWIFDEHYGWYLCTAVPAKRPRPDEEGAAQGGGDAGGSSSKGRGKGVQGKGSAKGKGKGKGPKGGCHECGGEHYARDCPVRAQRKGKGKGWESIPPRLLSTERDRSIR